MVSPATELLSVFITPWTKPTSSQLRHQVRLARHHPVQQRAVGPLRRRGLGVVAGDHVVSQEPHTLRVAPRGEVLERAHPDVARGHAGQDRARQRRLAQHRLAGRHRRERAGGRHAERRHGLGYEVLAQHGPERGPAVAAAREGRAPGALELDVAPRRRPGRPPRRAGWRGRRRAAARSGRTGGRRRRARSARRPPARGCRPGPRRPRGRPAIRDRRPAARPGPR